MQAVRRLIALGAASAVPLLLVAAVPAAPAAKTVGVTVTDSAFRLTTHSATVGKVTFRVTNRGHAPHSFRIAGKSTPVLAAGRKATLVVSFAKAGSFAYASTVKGDAAKGLKGVLTLRAAPVALPPIAIYAAASLTDAFPAIDRAQAYSFAGSNALATQIRNGAPADVFASANADIPAQLFAQGVVERPVLFTRNALVIVVPRSNPAGISSVYDLAKSGVRLDVAASSVPVGSYTLQVLKQMNLSSKVLPNVVSQETDVRSVLSKVALGQADAGFVYSTDATTVPNDVRVIKVPAWAQPKVVYAMAVVARSPNKAAARAFIRRVVSKAGQAAMLRYGFLPLPASIRTSPQDAANGV
jgi:molybdate transport system substrate-binding protein